MYDNGAFYSGTVVYVNTETYWTTILWELQSYSSKDWTFLMTKVTLSDELSTSYQTIYFAQMHVRYTGT